jgi:hypothetical protein
MKTPSIISAAALLTWVLAGSAGGAQETVSPATAAGTGAQENAAPPSAGATTPGASKVRIVRLSEVKGQVQLDRLTGKGFEPAMANLPIIEGAKLKTDTGVAEVEFEDNSTVRLAPDSTVEFTQLELLPGGVKASTVHVERGMVYASVVKAKGTQLTLKFGQQTATLPSDSHVRVQVTPTEAYLAVMHGDVAVADAAGTTNVGKNKTATFQLTGQEQPAVAKSYLEQPLDQWDSRATEYHKNFANASAYGNTPYAYGVSDLNYYGSFVNGCGGSFWRPYFASAAWDPYGSGAWAYYANAGYSWVSPYPWGWTPYHYGAWSFCQGIGWGWVPGGGPWLGLANYTGGYPVAASGFHNTFANNPLPTRPHPPVAPPGSARSTLVPVNMNAAHASSLSGEDKFVFRNDSAGLGVPRATLGKLGGFSNHVAQHGTASANVFTPAMAAHSQMQGPSTGMYPGGSPASSRGFDGRGANSNMQGPAGGMHSSMQGPVGGMHSSMQSPSGGGGGGMHSSAPSGGGGGGHR